MKLSVIIPVYNVEKYIKKCILSLEEQDIPYSDYELIIINDGSPDNSKEIIQELVINFDNIVFIDQDNKGVSLARNAGIDKAMGKYLLFIDPDDYVEKNSFSRILRAANESNADVVFLGYRFLNADDSIHKEILFAEEKDKVYPGIKAYFISRGDGTTDPDRSVAILYNREFINRANIRYIPNIPYLEDGELLARLMCLAKRCIFEGNPFYIRTTRLGSATNSDLFFSERATNGFIKSAYNLFEFQQKNMLSLAQKEFLNQPICKFVILAVNSSLKSKSRFKTVVKELKQKGFGKCELKGCKAGFVREGSLYNISPYVYATYKMFWSIFKSLKYRLVRN